MKLINLDLKNINPPVEEIAMCLGYFDGVHIGHRQIINRSISTSLDYVGVLTFDKPVSSFINNSKSKEVISSLEDRMEIFDRVGVDYLFVIPLSREFLDMTALEFIDILKKLNVVEIYVGEDYRFGKDQKGDIALLKKYFKVNVTKIISYDKKKVSTQLIISLIKEGKITKANLLLGEPYCMSGIISEGHHNGEKLGIRTANVKLDINYAIPKYGVYKVIIEIDDEKYLAIANVGVHPTIDQEEEPILEVHIPNYESIDYGKHVDVEFLEFVRPEKKFASLEELAKQINDDLKSLDR